IDLNGPRSFLANPCETISVPDSESEIAISEALDDLQETETTGDEPTTTDADALTLLRELIAAKTELPLNLISESSRLLDDLHLNSISVSQIVVEAARKLELPALVAPNQFASATVGQVAEAFEDMKATGGDGGGGQTSPIVPGVDSWVRCFDIEWIAREVSPERTESRAGVWTVLGSPDSEFGDKVASELNGFGSGLIVCLPQVLDESHNEFLLEAAKAAVQLPAKSYLVWIQTGQSVASLARTIHLETENLTTVVININDPSEALPHICRELHAANQFAEIRIDEDGNRFVPVMQLAQMKIDPSDRFSLSSDDLLLVTGGGKGIGAESALELARDSGSRLVLLGRSDPRLDKELSANLDRFKAASIAFEYFQVDIADRQATCKVVEDITARFGPVTAVVHSAGRNQPKLIESLTLGEFEMTLAPKLSGAKNILDAIDPESLKLFVAFGSIIGCTGLRGEADYAVANEYLRQFGSEFKSRFPHVRTHVIEWSVWSGVGMGERLGTLEELAYQGISPITIDSGLAVLKSILSSKEESVSTIVAGRFGETPTLGMEKKDLPLWRFLEEPKVYYPGIELVCESTLSEDSDPYFKDHVFKDQQLFPGVIGMEAMAQSAMAVTGNSIRPTMHQVRFDQPVVLPEGGKIRLRVSSLVGENGDVEVVVRSDTSSFAVDHFRSVCRFSHEQADRVRANGSGDLTDAVPLIPEKDIYGSLLFHTGRFQRLARYYKVESKQCLAEITSDTRSDWFSSYLPKELVLGDPARRDCAIHGIQVCVPQVSVLPVAVESVWIGSDSGCGPWTLNAIEQSYHDGLYT
ncbi:MAG: SDR family oxidoreductase, partial [candidate division Zixibacteria bacterium]